MFGRDCPAATIAAECGTQPRKKSTMSDTKTITVQSTAGEAGGHHRAGRFIPPDGLTLTLESESELEQVDRGARGIANADDLIAFRRDPRCIVHGYKNISRREAEAEDLAAAQERERVAAVRENKRRALLEVTSARAKAIRNGDHDEA